MLAMTFVCTLEPDIPLMMTNLTSEAGQGETLIRVAIGYDDVTYSVFSVLVCLATVAGYGELRHELVFHVVEATDHDEIYWFDGLETRNIITEIIDRERILRVICIATDMLIDQVAPVEVEMITHEPNLPPKALAKYGRVGSVFVNRGYVPARPDPYHGRHIWSFTQP